MSDVEARLPEVLRGHLWADWPNQTCGCGWLADSGWMTDRDAPNRVEQHLFHVAAVLAPIVADEVARATNTGIRLAAQMVRDHMFGVGGEQVADFLIGRADRVMPATADEAKP